MHVSPASVSAESGRPADLIMGVNWLGDSVMFMPALQAYRRRQPRRELSVVVRPHLAALWRMHPAIDRVWTCEARLPDMLRLARDLRRQNYAAAFVLPLSFRSALVPWWARVPERRGLPGHVRDWMLTRVVRPAGAPPRHQSRDYLDLMQVADGEAPPPALRVPAERQAYWDARLRAVADMPWVALMPGAAFGPAKRWPAGHFAAAGRDLQRRMPAGVVLLGSVAERPACREIAAQLVGDRTLDLAGHTDLTDLAAVLACCRLAVTNDSGGMHLATAVALPVVAVFGVTDPDRTGPLGVRTRVLQDSSRRDTDPDRYGHMAAEALARITPERAVEAALELAASAPV